VRTKAPALLPIFRSEGQARLLALLLLDPDRAWPGPELQARLDLPEPTFRREVGRLVHAGIVTAERVGRTKVYRAATDSPIYEPLRELVERTFGVETQLTQRLDELEGVEAAALFGSWADERLAPGSDVDLLVIGSVDFDAVADAVRAVEEMAGREIHAFVYTRDELDRKRAESTGFVRQMLGGSLKPLIGDVEAPRE
jgi:predicted nucleotidyltransferase